MAYTIMVIKDDLYERIAKRMRYWEQGHAFKENGVIDMTGIAFQPVSEVRKLLEKDPSWQKEPVLK